MKIWLVRISVTLVVVLLVLIGAGFAVYYSNIELIEPPPLTPTPATLSLTGTLPAAEGWSTERLETARLFADELRSTAVVAISGGAVVAEWGATDRRISGHSVRKSIVSALYGIAVDRGLIDVAWTLEELGIDDVNPPLSKQERSARIVDLLTARSGIYHDSVKADFERNRPARDSHPPDTQFYYNNWSFNALGGIFEELTDLSLGAAFKSWIADPIGMRDFRVEDVRYTRSDESVYPAYRFWISARDLALFGLLFQRNGRWGDQQVISAGWIKASTTAYSEVEAGFGYGYMWWTMTDGRYYASGTGGQKLLVDPMRELVVVNRVDTGSGIGRGLWFKFGPRIRNPQFRDLVGKIVEAAPDAVPADG